ncbi:SPX domain-containing protein [Hysterangium stoloniferum]|nr:SPX domain-containing protein [Hysterangium stoloniferum]
MAIGTLEKLNDFKGLKKRIAAIPSAKYASKALPSLAAPSVPIADGAIRSYGSTDNTPSQAVSSPPNSHLGRVRVLLSADCLDTGEEGGESAYVPHRSLSEGMLQKSLSVRGEQLVERGYASRLHGKRPSKPVKLEFFAYLDHELQKVDQFYNAREAAATARLSELKDQLRELADHRKLFYTFYAKLSKAVQVPRNDHWKLPNILGDVFGVTAKPPCPDSSPDLKQPRNKGRSSPSYMTNPERPARDPSEYLNAKRRLKKALREFYRSLELLNDYRILNLTGFRKVWLSPSFALKKYEKVTKLSSIRLGVAFGARFIHEREDFHLVELWMTQCGT